LAEPYAEMHPVDAAKIGIVGGDLVSVESLYGDVILRALVTDRATKGQVFAPMHWTDQQATSGKINRLTAPIADPVSGQPALKAGSIIARKFGAAWYGFGASITPLATTGRYAAISRTATGWQGEFAGTAEPADWEAFTRKILNQPHCTISAIHDAKSGLVRIAIHKSSTLIGLFFASATPVRLARSHVVSLIGTQTTALAALPGRGGTDHVDAGAVICACMNVGINTVRDAIKVGARTVETIGEATCAGTNCGSCKPELSAILAQMQLPMAAE